jgi:hypothetical protein
VHLGDRGRSHRLHFEAAENLIERLAVEHFELGDGLLGREGRHAILQLGQLVGEIRRQQIAPRRQHLTELHEDRTERFKRLAQAHRARLVETAAQAGHAQQTGEAQLAAGIEQHLVEPETQTHRQDLEQSQPAHGVRPAPQQEGWG